jgi:membrane-associated phospholipid phosphatase
MLSYITTKKFKFRFFRNLSISNVLIIIFFTANSSLASDSIKIHTSDTNQVHNPDSTRILITDTIKSHYSDTVRFHALDTIKPHNLDTVKINKLDSTVAKINLDLNKRHKKTIGDNLVEDFGIFFKDWGRFLTVPLRMKGTDWLIGGGAIGGTVLSSLADKRVKRSVSVQESGNSKNFYDIASYYGFIKYQAAFAAGLYLTGLFTRSDDVRETARMIMQSLTYSGTITIGLRYLFDRERPYVTDDPYKFNWFKIKSLDTQSFPSGHTAVAFATSTILAEKIGTWWSRVIFYGAAAVTGYSKIRTNEHWLSDVVFGAMLGFGSSWFVLKQDADRKIQNKKGGGRDGGRFSFYPSFNGFGIVYRL